MRCVEPAAPFPPVRHHGVEKVIETPTVVEFPQVAQFVDDYVVDQIYRLIDQVHVQGNHTSGTAAPPASSHFSQTEFRRVVRGVPQVRQS